MEYYHDFSSAKSFRVTESYYFVTEPTQYDLIFCIILILYWCDLGEVRSFVGVVPGLIESWDRF